MAYIGQGINNGTFTVLDTSGNTYNGSNATFDLGTQVGSPAQLLVSHDGVIQKPGTDYTLASNGTQITFTTEPASGASIFIVEISGAVGGPMNRDINGEELILDVDGDTSITADTDDQIDIKIAGADDFAFKANKFEVQTGSNVDMNGTELILDADGDTSITSDTDDQIDVKIGGTDQFSVKDGVIEPTTDNDVDIGSTSKEFKDGYFDGTLHCDVLDLAGTEYTSAGGRATLLSTATISSDSNVTFNNSLITSTYDNYLITVENVITGSGNIHLEMHASTDNGSSYETSSGDYRKISFNGIENESNNGFTSRYGTNEDDIRITGNYANNGNDAALKIDATIQCFTLNSSSYKKFLVHSIFGQTDDPPKLVYENAVHLFDGSQSAVNNLRIQASSGTLASGKIKLFGLA